MFTSEWFQGKHVTVMGLGLHGGGLGAAKWLLAHGAVVTVTDLRDAEVLAPSMKELDRAYAATLRKYGKARAHRIRYVLEGHDEADFKTADMVIQNPGVPREHPLLAVAKKHRVRVESEVSLFFLLCPFPITAVSGTKGKSTTTTLLAEICKASDPQTVIGGNIRVSVLESLDRLIALSKKKNVVPPPIVLELSSWQLESLEPHHLSPHTAVLTNILEDHLNRYHGMEDYARAKEIIVAFQREGDIAIMNADNARTAAIGHRRGAIADAPHGGARRWFSVKPLARGLDGCFVRGASVVVREEGKETVAFPLSVVQLPGKHNIANVLAATAAARAVGVSFVVIHKVVKKFGPVSGRLASVRTLRGITFVNDTTASTPDASIAAMDTFGSPGKKQVVLISGGADKELRFNDWAKKVQRTVKHVVMFDGSATPKMVAALAAVGSRVTTSVARSMREAVEAAVIHAKKGDTVLLSPGCASFGIFHNEFDRGDQFVALVKKLR